MRGVGVGGRGLAAKEETITLLCPLGSWLCLGWFPRFSQDGMYALPDVPTKPSFLGWGKPEILEGNIASISSSCNNPP